MMDGKLSREHIRRRILDNLSWGNLPNRVIEPLPSLLIAPPPPSLPINITDRPPERPISPAKRFAKKLLGSIPLLGRVAIVVLMPLLWPLGRAEHW